MSRLLPSLRYVAFVRLGLLHRAHDLIDYITGPGVVRLTEPMAALGASGVQVGWVVWAEIEDRFAPVLSAAFEALKPDGDSLIEPTRALYHVRFLTDARLVPCAGYGVYQVRAGGWVDTPIGGRDGWLASLGYQWMPSLEEPEADAARATAVQAALAAEPASGLSLSDKRTLMQARYSALLQATTATPAQLRALHGASQAMAEHLAGSTS